MSKKDQVLSKALKMKPIERVEIIDQLIEAFEIPATFKPVIASPVFGTWRSPYAAYSTVYVGRLPRFLPVARNDNRFCKGLLMQSLDKPDKEIDKIWKKEAEQRIDAYETGDIQTVRLQEVKEKYKNV